MRNIEFRAYDARSKKMYPCAIMGFSGSIHVHANEPHNGIWKNIGCGCDEYADYDGEVTVMQYTGCKDKNGNKIYEGDIIRWEFDRYKRDSVIYWYEEEAKFAAKLINHHNEVFDPSSYDNQEHFNEYIFLRNQRGFIHDSWTTVIGNVCQNPKIVVTPTQPK